MKLFKRKDKIEKLNNEVTDKKTEKKLENLTEEQDNKTKKEKAVEKASEVAKAIGAGVGFVCMCVGTLVMACFVAALEDDGEDTKTKDWREDEDLFKDIDYSADSEDTHSQVQIALDMTNLDERNDCVKTYLWMYKNIDNMPKTVKTVIGMTKGQIEKEHLTLSQADAWEWWSNEKDVAQKAMKQLKKYYSNVEKNNKIIILKGE